LAPKPGTAKRASTTPSNKLSKMFVLDTNVLMHDPTSLFRFEEHDVYLPMITLEELDNNKKGMTEVARNARQASRFLDEIVSGQEGDIDLGISLKGHGRSDAGGRLLLQTRPVTIDFPSALPDSGKADNQIIAVALDLQHHNPKRDRKSVV